MGEADKDGKDIKDEKKQVIILHQFSRTSKAPSPSPFPLKVETFLRMNKLEYTSEFKNFMGPEGKCPWITDDDGKVVPDSQFIIEHLMKKHNIKMLELTPQEEAVAKGLRSILEDNLYFAILTENCVYGDLELLMNQYPRFVPRFAPNFLQKYVVKRIKAKLGNQAKAQGIGRHSREEVRAMAFSDMAAISNWLGDKPYMMGTAPCPLDCSVFGFLAVLFYVFPETYFIRKEVDEKYSNLKPYTERIKSTFWPDWDELLSKD